MTSKYVPNGILTCINISEKNKAFIHICIIFQRHMCERKQFKLISELKWKYFDYFHLVFPHLFFHKWLKYFKHFKSCSYFVENRNVLKKKKKKGVVADLHPSFHIFIYDTLCPSSHTQEADSWKFICTLKAAIHI